MRISVSCGNSRKEVDFPIPDELEKHLLDLLKVEDAEKGNAFNVSAFNVEGAKAIKIRLTTFGFEKKV